MKKQLIFKFILIIFAIILPMSISAFAQKCQKKRISFPKNSNVLTLQGNTRKCNDFLIHIKKGQRVVAKLTSTKGNAVFYMMQHPITPEDEGGHGFCEDCRELNQYFDEAQDFHISVFHGSFGGLPEGTTNYKMTLTYTTPQTVNRGLFNTTPVNLPLPELPENTAKAAARGEVKVKVIVDEDGEIRTAEAISGHRLLAYEAEKKAFSTKFKLTVVNGKPVRVAGIIVYNFQ